MRTNKIIPNSLIHGDCLEEMKRIPDGSVDMILTDPPYGTTACKWDSVIPLNKHIMVEKSARSKNLTPVYQDEYVMSQVKSGQPYPLALLKFNGLANDGMWDHLRRIIKPNGAIVMTASQPFTTTLIASNMKMFKYDWVWYKSRTTGVLNAKRQPLRNKEDIIVFYSKQPTYNPQGLVNVNKMVGTGATSANKVGNATGKITQTDTGKYLQEKGNYPRQILNIKSQSKTVHPTQKPVELMKYLIKTYTNEGETVLDFTMGSGTTCLAAKNLNRKYIGIEQDEKYFEIAKERLL